MFYTLANRDEALFDEGDPLILPAAVGQRRSFAIGEYFCLGSHLASLELKVIFGRVIKRLRSHFINGIKEMRLCLTLNRRPSILGGFHWATAPGLFLTW